MTRGFGVLVGWGALLTLSGSAALGVGPQGYDAGCEGLAPVQTTCNGGSFVIGNAYVKIGYLLPPCVRGAVDEPCYVGDIQLVIDDAFGPDRRTCSILAAPGVDFGELSEFCTHSGRICLGCVSHLTCHSRVYATADGEVSGSGVPGGLGRWGCFVDLRPWDTAGETEATAAR